jgi:hypothetical protein
MKLCPKGHPVNTRNSYVNRRGQRICRVCSRLASRERYERDFRAVAPYQRPVISTR